MNSNRTIFVSLALAIVCNQTVIATDNRRLDAPLEPLLQAAQQKRAEIWTKDIPDIKALRHEYAGLFGFMNLFAAQNKLVSIEKSGSTWVKDLRDYWNTHPYASDRSLMVESSTYRKRLVDFSDEQTVDTIEQQCPPPQVERMLPEKRPLPYQASSGQQINLKTDSADGSSGDAKTKIAAPENSDKKPLETSIQVVPKDTKVPIIMDTPVNCDCQEGEEFLARTSEDLTSGGYVLLTAGTVVKGAIVLPKGTVVKGIIATISPPKHLNRSSCVELKFETITTPDNRQIPFVAGLVSHGGVLHVQRGLDEILMDTGVGFRAERFLLGKKGKPVDLRAGDALRIELWEDLRIPAS